MAKSNAKDFDRFVLSNKACRHSKVHVALQLYKEKKQYHSKET